MRLPEQGLRSPVFAQNDSDVPQGDQTAGHSAIVTRAMGQSKTFLDQHGRSVVAILVARQISQMVQRGGHTVIVTDLPAQVQTLAEERSCPDIVSLPESG